MIADRQFGSDRPLTWIGSFPVYLATILAAGHAVTMILTAIALGSGAEHLVQAFVFSSSAVVREFEVWQAFTYAFVHRPPYLLLLIEIYMLAVFGAEIEKFFGRAVFVKLYLVLLLLPAVVLSAGGLLGFQTILVGSGSLHFGIFMAFATLYPRAEIFFSIQARWIALAFFLVNAIQNYALGDMVGLGVLLLDCGAAVAFVCHLRSGGPRLRLVKRSSPTPVKKPLPQRETQADAPLDIDPILEKISRTGMASLTQKERDTLERARTALLSKERDG